MRLLLERVFQGALVLLAVSVLTFGLAVLLPADPARMVAGPSASVQTVNNIRHELGLDKPIVEQFVIYLSKVLRGNLGRSYKQSVNVTELLVSRFPATLELMLAGIAFELLLGIPMGVLAALRPSSFVDRSLMMLSFAGVSLPQFVLGLSLLYLFAFKLAIFPLGGYGSVAHIILPALTLGIGGAGWYARVIRSEMLEVLGQDYVRTATAKGVLRSIVITRHALKNALLPVIGMVGSDVGVFMGGVVVVESVFGWPGVGKLVWDAIRVVDIPVILGVVQLGAVMIVIGNLLADLAYPLADPRVRYA
jgi:ABC-type dipeptide/oligopeptide/nickel transport system permease component